MDPPHIRRFLAREAALERARAASSADARLAATTPFFARAPESSAAGAAQEARERLSELQVSAEQLELVRRERLRAQYRLEMEGYAAELAAKGLALQLAELR